MPAWLGTALALALKVIGLTGLVERWVARNQGRAEGAKDASLDAHEKVNENVTKAKRAAARVRTDDDLKRRVRKRYSPK